ncbi:hypothetical protein E4U21_002690 [Claviceps maximensis]|nr:hypothetical protein E4U21_002690 [Claviceps maximensis]
MSSASRTLLSRLATLPASACRRAQHTPAGRIMSWTSNSACQTQQTSVLPRKLATCQSPFLPSRGFSTTQPIRHGHIDPPKPGEELYVTFVEKDGQEHKFAVSAGDNLLDIAQANDVEMEGACGGSCACSTCHVIVANEDYYERIPEPEDDENDMLDLAFGLTETSRLGCQVKMTKELDGLVVKLPSMTRNLQASDFQ